MQQNSAPDTMTRRGANRMTKELARRYDGLATKWLNRNTGNPIDRHGTFEVVRKQKRKLAN